MRKLKKSTVPKILADNQQNWLDELKLDPKNNQKRHRYRHPEIKSALLEETSSKCIYCESKIGHNTPGDTEHKIPTSVNISKHFCWENLTLACAECNRRKSNYYNEKMPFLDPYEDDVEQMVVHFRPIVGWKPGCNRAEVTVRTLELHNNNRPEVLSRKIERIEAVSNLFARLDEAASLTMYELLKKELQEMRGINAEYSAMVSALCKQFGEIYWS